MATDVFASEVAALSSRLLEGPVSADSVAQEEQIVMEGYREALKKGSTAKLGELVDSAIDLWEAKKAPGELPFELFSDAVDMSTVEECHKTVWPALESRAGDIRKITLLPPQRPKLALLRVANELLRRISPTQDPMLCGRVLMLLATALPLSDNSGFNQAGKYNFENETTFDSQTVFQESGLDPKQYPVYERFWKLQRFFSGPVVLSAIGDLKQCLESTFQLFESKKVTVNDKDDSSNEEVEFNPKYLTAGRLLDLQLSDQRLRRFVLVQILFFLRQLGNAAEASNNVDLVTSVGVWRTRAMKLLCEIPPKGERFAASIAAAVERETVWEQWKKQKCPALEQVGENIEALSAGPDSFSKSSEDNITKEVVAPRWAVDATAQDWEDALLADRMDTEEEDDEYARDPLELHAMRMMDAFLPDYDFDVYDPRKDFVYCWQGMRLARQTRFDVFRTAKDYEYVVKVINSMPVDEVMEESLEDDDPNDTKKTQPGPIQKSEAKSAEISATAEAEDTLVVENGKATDTTEANPDSNKRARVEEEAPSVSE